VLRPELAKALGPDRFLQEIDIAAKLTHPHILALHDCGEADGFLYYVMPYIEGESLRDKLSTGGELPIPEAVRIIKEVVDALGHAHKHNVVHRDIKPDNVMLSDRHALVTDFGVAKAVSDATGQHKLTTAGVALGTPAYMAPEQAAADPHIDHRADIYAVGVVAYELLTGRTPFVGNTQQELLAAHVTQIPDPVTKYRESVPPALAQLVMKCLEKKAADRWQTAEELLPQLEALATPSGGITPTGTMPVDRVAKRRWMMVGGAVGVAVVIAIIAVMAALPRGSSVALDPNHVVVAEFRNATGDPSLDLLGERVGHWITQGLQQAAIAVTPWDQALQSWEYVQTEAEAGRVRDPVRALAEETLAGVVVSGAVYVVQGDTLEIQVNVTDAVRGTLLGSIDPLRASRAAESDVIAGTQQRVMAFLATRFEDRLADWAAAFGQPPSYEAYAAFLQGYQHTMNREYEDAIPYYRRAFELDSTWAAPLFRLRSALWLLGLRSLEPSLFAEADSVVRIVEGFGEWLTPYEQAVVQYMRAQTDGKPDEALAALRRIPALAPGSPEHYNLIVHANRRNRPREALQVLGTLDPERGWLRDWAPYWWEITHALHKLGEHKRELEEAQRGYRIHPNQGACMLRFQARALAALGRVDEIDHVLDQIEQAPDLRNHLRWLLDPADFLRLYGHTAAAQAVAERAINWFESAAIDDAGARDAYASALFLAGRFDDARNILDALVAEYPDNLTYRGRRGVLAVIRGDTAQATVDLDWLRNLNRPYLDGYHKFWRGVIVAAMGERETAMELLRQAFAEGTRHYLETFRQAELESLRGYPPFEEFMRPKG
jgi:tetratricopeptide (TPR) repeat protein